MFTTTISQNPVVLKIQYIDNHNHPVLHWLLTNAMNCYIIINALYSHSYPAHSYSWYGHHALCVCCVCVWCVFSPTSIHRSDSFNSTQCNSPLHLKLVHTCYSEFSLLTTIGTKLYTCKYAFTHAHSAHQVATSLH